MIYMDGKLSVFFSFVGFGGCIPFGFGSACLFEFLSDDVTI